MYTDLRSYQQTLIISDFTVEFVKRFIPSTSRTRDQMEQAARSGKQNIAEATSASKQKPKNEPFLLSVASASLKELLEDYKDFLRQHYLPLWAKDDQRALRVRALPYKSHTSYKTYISYLSSPEDACNVMICLINQTTYLIDQQIKAVEKQQRERGVVFESRNQRAARVLAAAEKREKEIDAIIAKVLDKK